jgi:prolyl-tRNA synthetase
MRAREFIMKDAYSFDATEEGANASYEAMRLAYHRIFERCGLRFREVAADSGNIGGSFSAEFMVLAQTGEDAIVYSDQADYAANVEKAELPEVPNRPFTGAMQAVNKVHTPSQRTIDEVSNFLGVQPADLIKTLVFSADGKPVVALVRGDHDINAVKLQRLLGADALELADPDTIFAVTGAPVGFAGPLGLKTDQVIADFGLRGRGNFVSGANEQDYHLTGLNLGRDFQPARWADIRVAQAGDPCPRGGAYKIERGIEVGHVFKLGAKYSQAMHCLFLDEGGQEKPMLMGCYGIGIGRTAAAAIEQNSDEKGIMWPMPIAPFQVIVVPAGKPDGDEARVGEQVYQELLALGVEAIIDDRDERPGVKFNDADLIGYPLRVTVGKKGLAEGKVEIKRRDRKDFELVLIADAAKRVKAMIDEALHAVT